MLTSSATLVHTSSRDEDNRLRMARVAAAARVQAERVAAAARLAERQARMESVAAEWVEDLRAAGAVTVGFKIIDDMGKYRMQVPIEAAAGVLVVHAEDEVEAWGINYAGDYAGESW